MRSSRLILAVVWFGLGGYLLWAQPEGPFGPWAAGSIALLFAIYNVVRWWADQPRGLPMVQPNRRRRPHDHPPHLDEYNEIFDFEKDKQSGKMG